MDKSFKEIISLTKNIAERFEKIEGRPWGIEGAMIELSKQVGDLAALVMVQESYYYKNRQKENIKYQASREKIADELSDLLLMIVRVAKYYHIDLDKSHTKFLVDTDRTLKAKSA